jgi:hypothetical protein
MHTDSGVMVSIELTLTATFEELLADGGIEDLQQEAADELTRLLQPLQLTFASRSHEPRRADATGIQAPEGGTV